MAYPFRNILSAFSSVLLTIIQDHPFFECLVANEMILDGFTGSLKLKFNYWTAQKLVLAFSELSVKPYFNTIARQISWYQKQVCREKILATLCSKMISLKSMNFTFTKNLLCSFLSYSVCKYFKSVLSFEFNFSAAAWLSKRRLISELTNDSLSSKWRLFLEICLKAVLFKLCAVQKASKSFNYDDISIFAARFLTCWE